MWLSYMYMATAASVCIDSNDEVALFFLFAVYHALLAAFLDKAVFRWGGSGSEGCIQTAIVGGQGSFQCVVVCLLYSYIF